MTQDLLVPIDALRSFAEALLAKLDVPAGDARVTASLLLETDLRGIESHGMAHLVDFYVRRLQRGEINPTPSISIMREAPSAATIDGDRGLGFVVGDRAMRLAIEKARTTGSGWVSVGNSTHYGAGSCYAMMALDEQMIGFSFTTGGRLMTPPGGLGRTVGLNVISAAAPTPRGFPYVLDMATSVVAAGKLEIARRRGTSIPEGWAVDALGRPLTDPHGLHPEGMLLPLGGSPATGAFKGFGLALLVDILTGALSGFGTSAEIDGGRNAAQCFGALRIDAFVALEEYLERVGGMIDAVKRTPRIEGVDDIGIPGELEHQLAESRRHAGTVPLHERVLDGFREAAEEFSVPFDLMPSNEGAPV
jgi:LDH2 family malate/lactate/ureidoglycolate dehydrogenase